MQVVTLGARGCDSRAVRPQSLSSAEASDAGEGGWEEVSVFGATCSLDLGP